ncbi:hypothetical protein HIM_03214 [Hirsutella minnesotensis 3608]|nr:hypothetical protein HIM_03214 [Hirsutella minnesotensis 3608]
MPEREALIGSYVHLDKEQRAKDALHTLQRIASLVKPIMRARGWKVGRLAEFYPDDPSLYGLNMNKGSKICLRLRYPGDRNQFMPFEEVTDTMLHELCHIVHGPHNERFHALWDQLRDELKGLMMKGYTGEGFLSQGRRLGGRRIPRQEAQRLARETAEKSRRQRLPLPKQGRRLGGAPVHPGQDMRSVIASAVERRNKVLQGCASERLNDSQIRDIADTATKTGFRTQAEEEEANEAAISQALWELVQEDEKQRLGDAYVPPSASLAGADEAGSAKPRELQSPASITRAGASRNVSDSGDSSGAAGKQSRSNEPTNWPMVDLRDVRMDEGQFVMRRKQPLARRQRWRQWLGRETWAAENRHTHVMGSGRSS